MKKILIIGPFPNPITGQSIANETFYKGLKEEGYNVDFIDTNFYRELTDKNKQGKFDLTKIKIIFKNFFKELNKIKKNNYDVIYMTPGGTFLGFIRFYHYFFVSYILKKEIIIHVHNGIFRKMYDKQNFIGKSIIKFFFKRIDKVIVLGNSLRSMFKELIDENKIYVCENGVQDEIVATEEEIEEKIERIKKSSKRKILYLSNLMREKGILELLKSSEELSEEEFEFNLAGAIEPSIKNIIDEYLKKYPNKIYYHGIVSGQAKKKLFLGNDVFILPSWDEGQPISILEAYATGCYVITDQNIGGIKDIFIDKINGKKIIAKNTESIKEGLKNLEKVDEINLYNYIFFKTNYTKNKFLERIIRVI